MTKNYDDVVALAGIDLDLEPGEVLGLLGRNGAGKSTLLSIIAGLKQPDSGSVMVDGLDVHTQHNEVTKLLGVAPQETGIYPPLTVRQNLEFFGELAGLSAKDAARRSREVAERFALSPILERKAKALSGGEARRLHTACALLHRPKLLLLDEPTVGADIETRNEIIATVSALAAEGTAVIYTTHYLPEVERLGADIAIIDDGQILASGTQDELISRHSRRGLRVEFDGDLTAALPNVELSPSAGGTTLVGLDTLAELVDRLGSQASLLSSVERVKADLETVFLAVTNREPEVDAA